MITQEIRPLLEKLTFHPASLEAVLSEMVLQGYLDLNEIEVYAKSTFARAYSRDIQSTRIKDYDDRAVLRVETNREGYYDQLPPSLFHRPKPRSRRDDADSRIETYRQTRDQVAAARKFFAPFEQNGFMYSIKQELSERTLIDPFNSPLREQLLLEVWPACKELAKEFYPLLSYILPLSHRVAGDLPLMEACYSALTQVPCKMEYIREEDARLGDSEIQKDFVMGSELGVDMVMDGQPVAELPVLQISFGPIRRSATKDYLPGGAFAGVLQLLADCLVPLDVSISTNLVYAPEEEILAMEDDYTEASYLGLTSTLNALTLE